MAGLLDFLLAPQAERPQQLPLLTPAATLKEYNPTFREQTSAFIADHLPSWLAPNQYEAQNLGDKFTTLAEFSPYGLLTAGDDYGRAKEQGDLPNMGLAALAAIPVLGKEARAAGDVAKEGIRAFHGSPHSFDKFSLDKIGSGEGAQAYGHGLYFAENEDVAKNYREALKLKGYDAKAEAELLSKAGLTQSDMRQLDQFLNVGADPATVARDFSAWTGKKNTPELQAAVKQSMAMRPSGSLYEVNIAADPNHFLDWDEPVTANSQQAVRDALNKIANSRPEIKSKLYEQVGQPGSMFYSVLGDAAKTGDLVKNQAAATQALKDAGIAGIKYKDAGSRFGMGEGTRNYVVFDDGLVNIVRKYGVAGAVSAGIISAEMGQQMQEQGLL